MTSEATHNVISSQELGSGPSRSEMLDGLTIREFGQVLAPANLSARQAKEMGLLTSGTSGPLGSTSSHSASLQLSLENRLRQVTSTLGSNLYKMTWKPWDTGSQRLRSRLRASALRTSETERTGWPTPTTRDHEDTGDLSTSMVRKDGKVRNDVLGRVAWMSGWNTPRASDWKGAGARTKDGAEKELQRTGRSGDIGIDALLATGITPNGDISETVSGDQLNPELPRWLMGLPVQWGHSMPGYEDWQKWQDLMQIVSDEPSLTESGHSAPTGTP